MSEYWDVLYIVLGALFCGVTGIIAQKCHKSLLEEHPQIRTDFFLWLSSWIFAIIVAIGWPVYGVLCFVLLVVLVVPGKLIKALFGTEGRTCCGLNCLTEESKKKKKAKRNNVEPDLEGGNGGNQRDSLSVAQPPPVPPITQSLGATTIQKPPAATVSGSPADRLSNSDLPTYEQAVLDVQDQRQ
ncbi:hypothetical protein QBC38DRAFT_117900 [Podospora fimiseda]|uniref:Uncharacterized protein n=1 Tax=Podospora fimiseda TaxID=252190 RepID=A0AAN6YM92_9PEZI|nr:hypothetical protein QBC38DRAFT_117900 [Podospora fimiseda]